LIKYILVQYINSKTAKYINIVQYINRYIDKQQNSKDQQNRDVNSNSKTAKYININSNSKTGM